MKETVLDCEFLILNRLPGLFSAQRFQTEITRLNRKAQLVTPEWLVENASRFESRGPGLGVLYRQGDFNFWPTQSSLSKLPFKIINSPSTFLTARDKWLTTQVWQKQNVPMPLTMVLTDFISSATTLTTSALFQTVQDKLDLPFMLKKRFSSQGQGVFHIKDEASLTKVLEHDTTLFMNAGSLELNYFKSEFSANKETPPTLWTQLRRWIVQECKQECLGQDVRVFTVKNKQYVIERKNYQSFLSNLHQGGQAQATTLTSQEKKLCEDIHLQSGLHYSGLDFLRAKSGPAFLEINPSPGFEGIEAVYKANIAAEILAQF